MKPSAQLLTTTRSEVVEPKGLLSPTTTAFVAVEQLDVPSSP